MNNKKKSFNYKNLFLHGKLKNIEIILTTINNKQNITNERFFFLIGLNTGAILYISEIPVFASYNLIISDIYL